jgi:hypothetical protein
MPRVSESVSDKVWRVPKPTSDLIRASIRCVETAAAAAVTSAFGAVPAESDRPAGVPHAARSIATTLATTARLLDRVAVCIRSLLCVPATG